MSTNFPKRYFSETAVNTFMPQKRNRILLAMRFAWSKTRSSAGTISIFQTYLPKKKTLTKNKNHYCSEKRIHSLLVAYQFLRWVWLYRKWIRYKRPKSIICVITETRSWKVTCGGSGKQVKLNLNRMQQKPICRFMPKYKG